VTSLWCRDVTLGRQVGVAFLALLFAQWVLSTLVFAQTLIIPSLSVSERYDSNVFYTPKALLGPDQKPEDFITTVIPQLSMAHANSLMRGRLSVGGLVSKFLNNPSLDYTGYNAAGQLDLRNAANKVSQRITSLIVRGTYQYTESPSGFAPTTQGGLGTGFGSTTSGTVLHAGIVTDRTPTHRYNLGLAGGYALTPTTTLSAGYNYNKIFFDDQPGGVTTLFNTTGHQGTTTISTQISARDTVGATATMSHYIQEQSDSSSGQGTFTTISETLNWRRRWTQELSTFLAGGGNVKLPVGSSIPGQSVNSKITPTATVGMTYSSFSEALRDAGSSSGPFDGLPSLAGSLSPGGIMVRGAYTASMRYTYSIFPSYAFGSGPMNTHLVGANATGGITSKLAGLVGMNYAHSTRDSPSFTADTLGVTVGARYLIGPVMAGLTYNWLYVSNSTEQSLGQSEYEYSKKMVMLSLSYAFTSESFFRMGEFGSTGTQGSAEGTSAPSGAGTGSIPSGDGSGIDRKE
jgi:hypothetical protein